MLQPSLFSFFALLVHASDYRDERQDECNEHHKSTQEFQNGRLLAKNYQPIEVDACTCTYMYRSYTCTNVTNLPCAWQCMRACSKLPASIYRCVIFIHLNKIVSGIKKLPSTACRKGAVLIDGEAYTTNNPFRASNSPIRKNCHCGNVRSSLVMLLG